MAVTPTHVVFSKPEVIDGVFHRGFMTTDYPPTIEEQVDLELWSVGMFFHAPVKPLFDSRFDLYFACPSYTGVPEPRIAITNRDLVRGSNYQPIPGVQKRYDVVFNMNWLPFKRHELFIEALAYSKANGRSLKTLWFGYHYSDEAREREKFLTQMVADKGLEVEFAETDFDLDVINRRYSESSVCVICSEGEGGPRVLTEAMLCDVPVVVTNDTAGGTHQVIESNTGRTCDPTPESLARCIHDVLDDQTQFEPRRWALENMCLEQAMPKLLSAIRALSAKSNVPINTAVFEFTDYDWECKRGEARKAEKRFRKQR